jgi:hypothetical protein
MIAADDCEAGRAFLPSLADRRWISVRALAAEAWPLARDLCLEDLWDFLNIRHPAIDELPIARGEIEALTAGLVLREALRAASVARTFAQAADGASPEFGGVENAKGPSGCRWRVAD